MSQLGAAIDNGSLPVRGLHGLFQHNWLGGLVWKSEEGSVAVGDGGEGDDEDRSNGLVTGDDVQGSVSYGAVLQDWESDSDGGDE